MANFRTKPKGIHATFRTDCGCGGELTVTNGRVDPHQCRIEPAERPVTLAQIRAALDNRNN